MKIIKNRYFSVISVIVLLFIILFVISFFSNDCYKDKLSDVFNWLSGLSSLVTLIIALLLFDKYGLNKKIDEKKQDVVLELLDELSNSILIIDTNLTRGGRISVPYVIASEKSSISFVDFENKILIFSEDYTLSIFRIGKYSKKYWMPKSIKEKLNQACIFGIVFNDKLDPFDEKFVRVRFSSEITNSNDNDLKYGVSVVALDIDTYINRWVELHQCIIKWINDHADFKLSND